MWSVITVLDVASPDVEAVVTAALHVADQSLVHDHNCVAFEVHRDLYSDRVALVQRYRDTTGHTGPIDSPTQRLLERRITGLAVTSRTTITSRTTTTT